MLNEILDAFLDTLKIIPFLFLAYLLMEWLEHKLNGKTEHLFEKTKSLGPLLGGTLGILPQCGFSAAAATLFSGKIITLGTIFAVFLSTSDEMLLILLSHSLDSSFALWSVIRIVIGKMIIGIIIGFLTDLFLRVVTGKKQVVAHEDVHVDECYHAGKEKGIIIASILHTLEIAAFLFVISCGINLLFYYVGEDKITLFLTGKKVLSYILASLVGSIPNCVASVTITELYVAHTISLGALYAGLLPGAGVGILVLFRSNKPFWKNILIAFSLCVIGIFFGFIIDYFNLSFMGLKFI